MGSSTSSMFIFFSIIIALYIAGASVYALVSYLRKKRKEK